MIEYYGRMMACFMQRQTHRGGCELKAEYIVEGPHLFMHMCHMHAHEWLNTPGYTVKALVEAGEIDTIEATVDDRAVNVLLLNPWIVSVNGRRRA